MVVNMTISCHFLLVLTVTYYITLHDITLYCLIFYVLIVNPPLQVALNKMFAKCIHVDVYNIMVYSIITSPVVFASSVLLLTLSVLPPRG